MNHVYFHLVDNGLTADVTVGGSKSTILKLHNLSGILETGNVSASLAGFVKTCQQICDGSCPNNKSVVFSDSETIPTLVGKMLVKQIDELSFVRQGKMVDIVFNNKEDSRFYKISLYLKKH